jgi:glycine/D-amino acid oxidase-like deaminating enzyme
MVEVVVVGGGLVGVGAAYRLACRGAHATLVDRAGAGQATAAGAGILSPGNRWPRAAAAGAGAWSDRVAGRLGLLVPVAPQRGQLAHLLVPGADTGRWRIVLGFGSHYLLGGHRWQDAARRPPTRRPQPPRPPAGGDGAHQPRRAGSQRDACCRSR